LDEPYVIENSPLDLPPVQGQCQSRRFDPVTIGAGKVWVMGDHRLVSQDSRCQGPVAIKDIIGRAFVVVWPSQSWESLPIPKTFEKVPRPKSQAVGAGLGNSRGTGGTTHLTALETTPVVPRGVDVLLPFVWTLSHRRVRRVSWLNHDVGSTS
jgi:hypothetical protein